jgi:hypothetical protein
VGELELMQELGKTVNSRSRDVAATEVEAQEAAPLSGVVALNHLAAQLAADTPKVASAKRHLPPSRLGEEELRKLIAELTHAGSDTLAYVVLGPQAALEPVTNLPELFWKLVERRVFGAVFSYERGGRRYEDRIVSTPGGFSLDRALSD